jgi:outer membrane protein assembly factor BamB
MRCPNNLCREVFIVQEEAPPSKAARPALPNADAPAIQDAEIVSEVPAPPQAGSQDREQRFPLPAKIQDEFPAEEKETLPSGLPVFPDDPLSPIVSSWDRPPPVRRPVVEEPVAPGFLTPGEIQSLANSQESETAGEVPIITPRRALILIGIMIVIAGFVVSGLTVAVLNRVVKRESDDYQEATHQYANGKYALAAQRYNNLIVDYPESKDIPNYKFFIRLSELLAATEALPEDPHEVVAQTESLVDDYRTKPILREYRNEVQRALRPLAARAADYAAKTRDAAMLGKAKKFLELSHKLSTEEDTLESDSEITEKIATAQGIVERQQMRERLLQDLHAGEAGQLSASRLAGLKESARRDGILEDPAIRQVFQDFERRARGNIRFVPATAGHADVIPAVRDPSLFLLPWLSKNEAAAGPQKGASANVVLALARGVLYVLDEMTGEVRWVMRVGVDTTELPIRLPRTAVSPELFLVLSADRNLIMALEAANGMVYWQHALTAPCLSRPVVIDRRAYVPTYDGKVHEIEIIEGNILGSFDLGQPLVAGGVHQEGTDLLYFPGESENVYVLDAALSGTQRAKQCVRILHTHHPAGSLRSAPIIVSHANSSTMSAARSPASRGFLILNQADGLDHMTLRVFGLPLDDDDDLPLMNPEPRVSGWSWFQPYFDQEKLAFVTDAGVFGFFGLNQLRNDDRPVFSFFRNEYRLRDADSRAGRAQVVHAVENDVWLLANSELERFHIDIYGQKLLPLWVAPLPVGLPLHAGQADFSENSLVVVTRDSVRNAYLVTAADTNNGTIRWQRMLGLDPLSDPRAVGKQTLLVDKSGAVASLAQDRQPLWKGRNDWWKTDVALAPPLGAGAQVTCVTTSNDGKALFELAVGAKPTSLMIRSCAIADIGKPGALDFKTIELPAAISGTPAVGPGSLLLPLADGTVQRLNLPLDGGAGTGGPNWRAGRTDDGALGHLIQLNPDEFLATDGSRGITHWLWRVQDKNFQALPSGSRPTVDLSARIVSRPLVLEATEELTVCAADADGKLTLLRGPELHIERAWNLRGKITMGPFQCGSQIGCIVDRRRLCWIDPKSEKPLWQFTVPGEAIVGQPQLIGDLLVVADLSGQFIGLDPVRGVPLGAGYRLGANAVAAVAPVAHGPQEAYVPLTDGTLFILDLSKLRGGHR